MRHARFVASAICLLVLASTAAGALSLDLRTGPMWIGNAYREQYTGEYIEGSDVSPLLILSGASINIPLDSRFDFSPGLDIWYKDYAFTEGRGVPTQIETAPVEGREVAGTLGLLLSMPVDARFPVAENMSLFTGFSPTLLIRAPIAPVEGSPTEQLTQYFYSDMRFLYPEVRVGGSYAYADTLSIRLSLRGFAPVTRLADPENDLPWWDQLMLSGQIGLSIQL